MSTCIPLLSQFGIIFRTRILASLFYSINSLAGAVVLGALSPVFECTVFELKTDANGPRAMLYKR